MKLRIQGNSVRFRLSRAEVSSLAAGQTISQITAFSPTSRLTASLRIASDAAVPSATFVDSHLQVVLPREQARHWAQSDEHVAISASQPVASAEPLSLLFEKDFECLHRSSDSKDVFPNPQRHRTGETAT